MFSASAGRSRFVLSPFPVNHQQKSNHPSIAVLHLAHSPSSARADQACRGEFSLSKIHPPPRGSPNWPIRLREFVTSVQRPIYLHSTFQLNQ